MKSGSSSSSSAVIETIAQTIGQFSQYRGMDGKLIYGTHQRQAFLAKQLLAQLLPEDGWESSAVTTLKYPLAALAAQELKIHAVDADTAAAFGPGCVTISTPTLKKLADSARITTNTTLLPPALFLEIQHRLRDKINMQEKRTLKEILGHQYESWATRFAELGFSSRADFDRSSNIPLNTLALNVCHSQELHFFVEQHLTADGKALNSLRNQNLNGLTPSVLLSTPGMNFAYGGHKAIEYLSNGSAKIFISNMWETVLKSAEIQGCRHLAFSAIGLGAFLPGTWSTEQKAQVTQIYYQSLMEQLAKPKFHGKFDSIHINPVFDFAKRKLEEAKSAAHPAIGSLVHQFAGDVKFFAVECAKNDIKCGLLNPSDPDVMWGKYDIGEYYKTGDYVGEEDLAATSTASLGSVGLCDVYTNRTKINGVGNSPSNEPLTYIQLYSATMSKKEISENKVRLAIKFQNEATRDLFISDFHTQAQQLGVNTNDFFTILHDANPGVVYIEPSSGRGSLGAYVSRNNELSINFGHHALRDFFARKLAISQVIAEMPKSGLIGDTALYFRDHQLKPQYASAAAAASDTMAPTPGKILLISSTRTRENEVTSVDFEEDSFDPGEKRTRSATETAMRRN